MIRKRNTCLPTGRLTPVGTKNPLNFPVYLLSLLNHLVMKSFLFSSSYLLFQSFFCFTAKSQDSMFIEVMKNECKDSACFNSFITKKGFKYVQSTRGGAINFIRYRSSTVYLSTSEPTLMFPDVIEFSVRDKQAVDITFATAKFENYTSVTKELKQQGFKFKKIEQLEGDIGWVSYTSSAYPKIMMFTTYPETKGDDPCIIYKIRFMRLPWIIYSLCLPLVSIREKCIFCNSLSQFVTSFYYAREPEGYATML